MSKMGYSSDNVRGALFGLAFGDALGAATEFMETDAILHRWPPNGPDQLRGNPARVTDDTQMMIAVGRALVAAGREGVEDPNVMERLLRKEFIGWYASPDNNRAPGMTCMEACANLSYGAKWQRATMRGSKGCGANMRVAPVAFVHGNVQGALSQFQSALTHGHPTALAASDLTAFAVAALASGTAPLNLIDAMRAHIEERRFIYESEWLGDLWEGPAEATPQTFIGRGWEECSGILDRLEESLTTYDGTDDPCLLTGEGWIAEEAMGTALLCFLTFPDEPVRALQRAATTCGDSDSIACLAGAFAGAFLGDAAWPADWFRQVEYAAEIEEITEHLSAKTTKP